MITLTDKVQVSAVGVRFQDENLIVLLSDEREIVLPLHHYNWLKWLAQATAEQRNQWTIEPDGFAIYWENLDDGIEIEHLLSLESLG